MQLGEVDVKQTESGLTFTLRWWQLTLIILALGGGVIALRDSNTRLGAQIMSLDNRLGGLSQALSDFKLELRASDDAHGSISTRIGKLEAMTARGVPPDWMVEQVEKLEKRVDRLEDRRAK
jgi:hypothetical protein